MWWISQANSNLCSSDAGQESELYPELSPRERMRQRAVPVHQSSSFPPAEHLLVESEGEDAH